MGLNKLADGVWVARQDFKVAPYGNIGTTMTVIRLSAKELFLISPIELTDEIRNDLKAIGTPRYIIGPNAWHHSFIKDYQLAYPGAKLYGPASLVSKRSDLRFYGTLTENIVATPWVDFLEQFFLTGRMQYEEVLFFHHSSRTLVVTDLYFNINQATNWRQKLMLQIMGGFGGLRMPRLIRWILHDQAVRIKLKDWINNVKPTRIVLPHGEVYSGNYKTASDLILIKRASS